MISFGKMHQRLREIAIEQDIRQDIQSCPRCGKPLDHPMKNNPLSLYADVRICPTCEIEEMHSKYVPPSLWKFAAALSEETLNDLADVEGCA